VAEARTQDFIALLDRGDGGTIVVDPTTIQIKKLLRAKEESTN
jgi:hypothetical protein